MTGPLLAIKALWGGPWGIGTILRRIGRWLDSESAAATTVICIVGVGVGAIAAIGIVVLIWVLLVGYLILA